jgi:AcrR family transcriptional regulator
VPTGVALRDVREQLFRAAERILLKDGQQALTSRAVTEEAGVAKGVLHRHFADFDAFLADLVRDRIGRIERQAAELRAAAGGGTVEGNLAEALTSVFSSVAMAVVGLITARDGLRARLRADGSTGVPLLGEATGMIAGYLGAERDLGRLDPDADTATLALMLIGTGHLLFAGRRPGGAPEPAEVGTVVTTVLAGVLR